MKKLIHAVLGLGILTGAAGLHYAIPRVSTAQIVGVEVKRVDGETGSRDVYIIQAQDAETERVRVFRNEDALLYFKLNSADVQARATALSRGEPLRTVAIRHYGWRVPMFSIFPNALSVREVEPGYRHVPVLGPLLLIGFLLVPAGLIWRARKRKKVLGSGRVETGRSAAGPRPDSDETMSWLAADDRRTGAPGPGSDGGSGSDGGGGSDA